MDYVRHASIMNQCNTHFNRCKTKGIFMFCEHICTDSIQHGMPHLNILSKSHTHIHACHHKHWHITDVKMRMMKCTIHASHCLQKPFYWPQNTLYGELNVLFWITNRTSYCIHQLYMTSMHSLTLEHKIVLIKKHMSSRIWNEMTDSREATTSMFVWCIPTNGRLYMSV